MSDNEDVEDHESFGMVSLTRWHSNKNLPMFGSAIGHMEGVTLRISRVNRKRMHSRFWYHEQGRVAEIDLTSNQLCELLTRMNSQGTQCTLRYVRDGNMQRMAEPPQEHEGARYKAEVEGTAAEAIKALQEQAKRLRDAPKVGKKDQAEFARSIDNLVSNLAANLPFVVEQLHERMEDVVTDAKREVDAYAISQGVAGVVSLPGAKEEK